MRRRLSAGEKGVLVFMATAIVLAAVGSLIWVFFEQQIPLSLEERREILAKQFTELKVNGDGLSESGRFDRYVELLLEDLKLEYPEVAVFYGFGGEEDRISVPTRENREYQDASTRFQLDVLRSIDALRLDEEQFLNYGLLERKLSDTVGMQKFPTHCLTFDQMWGFHQEFQTTLETTPNMESAEGYRNYLSRMEYFDDIVLATMANLSGCLERGITPPKVTLPAAAEQIRSLMVEDRADSPYLKPFTDMPDGISVLQKATLRDKAASIYRKDVGPSLDAFLVFLEDEYIPGARETLAMNDLPDGQAWYTEKVRGWTTTDQLPQEIHEIGLAEVERIRGEMIAVKGLAGFDGSLEAFGTFLRTDSQFRFRDGEHVLRTYKALEIVIDEQVERLFERKPNLAFEIVEVPEHLEQSVPDAFYRQGSPADDRPGRFYVNTYNPQERSIWVAEDLFLHEAIPGHHFQLAIGQELEITWFRRMGDYGAFVEGWGLYAETLGEELGFYQNPYQRYGQLIGEQWRAVRLVVDTGLHEYGWSRQQAIDFFHHAVAGAIPDHQIEVEVDRYIVMPGQALSYKIGQLKFRELRTRAETELGDRFDVREFHDYILGGGALPLNILESRFDKWLSEQ